MPVPAVIPNMHYTMRQIIGIKVSMLIKPEKAGIHVTVIYYAHSVTGYLICNSPLAQQIFSHEYLNRK